MGITLFTTTRPLEGQYSIIQTNALRSWGLLSPAPERIVVFADEAFEGQKAIGLAESLGFAVLPVRHRSGRGVPLVSDLFSQAREIAGDGIAAYTNADIILDSGFVPQLQRCVDLAGTAMGHKSWPHSKSGLLMVCRRWNVQVMDYLDFEDGWHEKLVQKVEDQGSLMDPCAIDLFAWTGQVWPTIPGFAIGRYAWDNWLVGKARESTINVAVVDMTKAVRLIHQSHAAVDWYDPDSQANFKLATLMGGMQHSTHMLTLNGLVGK